jgi:hypothetical protein
MYVGATHVGSALAGLPYPARLWQIVAQAEHNGAAQSVRDALLNIPARLYAGPADIANAVHASSPGSIAPDRPCHHKRHPKSCRGHDWHFQLDDLAS